MTRGVQKRARAFGYLLWMWGPPKGWGLGRSSPSFLATLGFETESRWDSVLVPIDLASSNGHPHFMDSMISKLRVWPIWKELKHFAVSAACEDSSTSTRTNEFCRSLTRDLARNCTIAKEIWLFNQLCVPQLRAIAASEATLAPMPYRNSGIDLANGVLDRSVAVGVFAQQRDGVGAVY